MKISRKLHLGFISIFAIVVGLAAMLFWTLHRADSQREMITHSFSELELLNTLKMSAERHVREMKDMLILGDPNDTGILFEPDRNIIEQFNKIQMYFRECLVSDDEFQKENMVMLYEVRDQYGNIMNDLQEVLELRRKGRHEASLQWFNAIIEWDFETVFIGRLLGLIDRERLEVENAVMEAEDLADFMRLLSFAIAGLTFLLIGAVSFVIIRSITGPIEKLKLATSQISGGNFDFRVNLDSMDEFAALADSFNVMALGLKESRKSLVEVARLEEANRALEDEITERIRVERSLRESEQKYRSLVDNIEIGISLISPDMEILSLNRQMQEWFPWIDTSSKPICFKTFNDPPREDVCTYCPTHKTLKDGVVYESVTETPTDSGIRNYRVISSPVLGEDGKVVAATELVEDITERRQMEDNLRRLALIAEQASEGIAVATMDGTITFVNKAWADMHGYECHELIGQHLKVFHTELQMIEEVIPFNEMLRDNDFHRGEVGHLRKDGSTFPAYMVTTKLRDSDNTPIGMVGFAMDITERKRAEEELKLRTMELERSNAELEQFAYIASHDLQEPLRMVASYLELLEKRYKDRLDKDADDFIFFAVDGAKRMQVLINDLLTYSRVGTRAGDLKEVDCAEVLERALANLQVSIEESGARVSHDLCGPVVADPQQLVQLYQNLIGNAIKFRGSEPPDIHIGVEHISGEHVFCVRDNGIGMEPENREQIFLIFRRLHNRAEYPGTGIGLALCKKIVERHGGRIWVESEPGRGSEFYFSIPERR